MNLPQQKNGNKKLYVILAALLGLAVVFMMLSALSGNDNTPQRLSRVVYVQNQTLSVVREAKNSVRDIDLKNILANAEILIASDITQLNNHGELPELSEETIAQLADPNFSERFRTAQQTNDLEPEVIRTLQSHLERGVVETNSALELTTDQQLKTTLNRSLQNQTTLLDQVNQL